MISRAEIPAPHLRLNGLARTLRDSWACPKGSLVRVQRLGERRAVVELVDGAQRTVWVEERHLLEVAE